MTITVVGFNGSYTDAVYSRVRDAAGKVQDYGVVEGFDLTAGPGTREVRLSAGTAVFPGLLVTSDAIESRILDANSSSATRRDIPVLRADWDTKTVVVAVVKGTSATPPALTQNPGVRFEMPLGRVRIPAGYAAAFTASAHLVPAKPLPRVARRFTGTTVAEQTLGPNASPATISTVSIPDPGWPYVLDITAAVRFGATDNGFARLNVIAGDEFDAQADFGNTLSARLTVGGPVPGVFARATPVLTGRQNLALQASPFGMSSPAQLQVNNNAMNHFTVVQHPA